MIRINRRHLIAGAAGLAVPLRSVRAATAARISFVKMPFNLPHFIMVRQRMVEEAFKTLDATVEYKDIASGTVQAQAMAAGDLDMGAVMNATAVLLARAAGNPLMIVGGFSRPSRTFALLARKESIQTVRDLKGVTVAGGRGSILHQLLLAALVKDGMKMDDVNFVNMGTPEALQALTTGQVDAALLVGDLIFRAQERGARIIATAEGNIIPKLVVVGREAFVKQHGDLVARYMEVQGAAIRQIGEKPEESLKLGADVANLSLEDCRKLNDASAFITKLTPADVASLQDDIRFMVDQDMMKAGLDVRTAIHQTAL